MLVHFFNHNPMFVNFLVDESTHRMYIFQTISLNVCTCRSPAYQTISPRTKGGRQHAQLIGGSLGWSYDVRPTVIWTRRSSSSYTSDPSQKVGIRSTMPKSTPPKKLEQIQNQESKSYLMESVYELKACQQYLKVNSANPEYPLTMFPVSGLLHSTIIKFLDENTGTGRYL